MDWDTFTQRWNERRLAREAKELRRAERTGRIVFVLTALLAGFIVLQFVWGYMA